MRAFLILAAADFVAADPAGGAHIDLSGVDPNTGVVRVAAGSSSVRVKFSASASGDSASDTDILIPANTVEYLAVPPATPHFYARSSTGVWLQRGCFRA